MISEKKSAIQGIFIVFFLLSLGSCSNNLLSNKDYRESLNAYYHGSPAKALKKFPNDKERGTFIAAMERAYLSLLAGTPEIAPLEKYADIEEQRVLYDVSREIGSFFYIATPEGYYASEHELVWLHLLLSWGYSYEGEFDKARVEASRASFLLEAPWSYEGHFDDPMLRLLSAAIWAMAGSWEDARVDLRAAAELDPSLAWGRALAEKDRPPKTMVLVLGGVGPFPYWDPEAQLNPLRGFRNLGFRFQGRKSRVEAETGTLPLTFRLSPDSSPWYQRHLTRDSELHELIGDTRYGMDAALSAGKATGETIGGILAGVAIATTGVALGVKLAELAVEAGSGEGVVGGVGIALAGVKYGIDAAEHTADDARENFRSLDSASYYRFVRFFPSYAWIAATNEEIPADFRVAPVGRPEEAVSLQRHGAGAPRVFIGHLPDVDGHNAEATIWVGRQEEWQEWLKGLGNALNMNPRGKTRRETIEHYRSMFFWTEVGSPPDLLPWGGTLQEFFFLEPKTKPENGAGRDEAERISLAVRIHPGSKLTIEIRRGVFESNDEVVIDLKSMESEIKEKSIDRLVTVDQESLLEELITKLAHFGPIILARKKQKACQARLGLFSPECRIPPR